VPQRPLGDFVHFLYQDPAFKAFYDIGDSVESVRSMQLRSSLGAAMAGYGAV